MTHSEELIVNIKKILFFNKNYLIAVTETNEKIVGYTNLSQEKLENETLKIIGNWEEHKKYGKQFLIQTCSIKTDLIEKKDFDLKEYSQIDKLKIYLKEMIGYFQEDALDFLSQKNLTELEEIFEINSDVLLEFKRIGVKNISKIQDKWKKNKKLMNFYIELLPYQITPLFCEKLNDFYIIKRRMKIETFLNEFRKNPYMITEMKNIGFKKADNIALSMGLKKFAKSRIRAFCQYILENIAHDTGDTALTKDMLFIEVMANIFYSDLNVEKAKEKINNNTYEKEKELFLQYLQDFIEEDLIIELNNEYISSKKYFIYEKFIYEYLIEKRKKNLIPYVDNIDDYLITKENEYQKTFGREQKEALTKFNFGHQIYALCGYAGTGKSTIAKAMIDIFKYNNKINEKDMVVTALSGIATERIKSTTCLNGFVLSYLIFATNEKILPYKLYVIDEVSMINTELFYYFLKKVRSDAIIIIGDTAQLPPIGSGNFFTDIIENGIIAHTILTEIFRISDRSVIKTFANSIRMGLVPKNYHKGIFEDFKFTTIEIENYKKLLWQVKKGELDEKKFTEIKRANYKKIEEITINTYQKYYTKALEFLDKKDYYHFIFNTQIIIPIKNNSLGTKNINQKIKNQYLKSHSKEFMTFRNEKYYVYEKIVHNTNIKDMTIVNGKNYDLNHIKNNNARFEKLKINNGMQGMIIHFNKQKHQMWVYFPAENIYVCYPFKLINDRMPFETSYAMTIHKTQGSEYNNLLIPISYQYFIMLNNKLLYTGITRAQKYIEILGETMAFNYACTTIEETKRSTVIQQLVKKDFYL